MEARYVAGMGEVLWDLLPAGRKLGGAPANFAYHVAQFGLESRIVSAVGRDRSGDELMEELRSRRIGTLVERVDRPTGEVAVELDGAGIPRYDIREDAAWDNIPFTPQLEELARATRAVCFGSLAQRSATSRATIGWFLDAMPREEGRYRIFDINLRQRFYDRSIVEGSMERCDILKINDEELEVVAGLFGLPGHDVETQCRELIRRFRLRIAILTCGAHGSHVFTPDSRSFVPTPKVEVADTVGAGDSFTATFAAALLHGKPVGVAHELAAEVSAWVCTQHGAMPRLPEELRRRVAE